MSAPKSVVKIKKDGVTYTSNVAWCEWTIKELSRAALRDVAKFVTKRFRENYYKVFKRKTGNAGRATKYTVYSSEKTIYPHVDIGLKKGKVPGFYAYYQETGTSKQKRLGILEKTVKENIATIVEIESKYLTGLEDEAKALALIDSEDDYEGGGEE